MAHPATQRIPSLTIVIPSTTAAAIGTANAITDMTEPAIVGICKGQL
jgi:hypothetical protein